MSNGGCWRASAQFSTDFEGPMIHGGSEASQTLSKKAIHEEWISDYESGLNDAFYELAIDAILSCLNPAKNVSVLDAGCGDASKSIRLAARGWRVTAMDFSPTALGLAKQKIENSAFANSIDLRREDLRALSFDDGAFDKVLCWGVLMHIPSVQTAVEELARVTRSKGFLVIQESNMRSMQSVTQRSLMRLLGKDMSAIKMTERGAEKWRQTADGILLTRNANIEWLIRCVEANGLKLRYRFAGEFTILYVRVPWKFCKKAIMWFNRRWLANGGSARLAFTNILIFQKQ
jgi:2-polyprenyl-3-methyl-5-hydroxy-6-metoxy-1,4-benzoquinol methylase